MKNMHKSFPSEYFWITMGCYLEKAEPEEQRLFATCRPAAGHTHAPGAGKKKNVCACVRSPSVFTSFRRIPHVISSTQTSHSAVV